MIIQVTLEQRKNYFWMKAVGIWDLFGGGEFENVSILVAIGVDENGYREVIGAAEGMKEDAESWKNFLVWLKERGLDGGV